MAFIHASSPHTHTATDTASVMKRVILATVPGIVALTVFFGFGTINNLILCSIFCLGFEALSMKIRKRDINFHLRDYSALVTAILLGIALPPFAPWWLILVGSFFAIVVAKQLYGGLGFNPFNPAMIAYVVLLISFPVDMTQWVSASNSLLGVVPVGEGLSQVFFGSSLAQIDGYTGATPLDVVKQNGSLLLADLYQSESQFSQASWAGLGWEWANLGFLIGGAYLLYRKVFTWHAPIGMLMTLAILSVLFFDGGSSTSLGSPLFHLFSGGTMLGAFFIITDPVSSAVSNKGRLIYGACIGALIFIIRAWGNYPDAVAFAVLLMNFAAPFIDYYTLPRSYGHEKANSGRIKHD
ncbi:MAG: electron transport complex subunit RsxD [Agarilytica sp.]